MLHDEAMMLAGAGLFLRPRNSRTSRTRAAPHVVPSTFGARPCGTMPTLLFAERQSSIAAAPAHHNENEYGSLDSRAELLMSPRARVRVVVRVAKRPRKELFGARPRSADSASRRPADLPERSRQAVSYTHLTLPTNREV